jgi:hypothetical protein
MLWHPRNSVSHDRSQSETHRDLKADAFGVHISTATFPSGQHVQGQAIMETKIVDLGRASKETQGTPLGSMDSFQFPTTHQN